MKHSSSISVLRLIPVLMLLSLLLCACAKSGGRTDAYDGFTVRTERADAPEAQNGERSAFPERSLSGDSAPEEYVLNKASKCFHYPECSAAAKISEKNRWVYRGTRDSVIELGYEPCQLCSP